MIEDYFGAIGNASFHFAAQVTKEKFKTKATETFARVVQGAKKGVVKAEWQLIGLQKFFFLAKEVGHVRENRELKVFLRIYDVVRQHSG